MTICRKALGTGVTAVAAVAALIGGGTGTAHALDLNLGNPDLKATWGNTVRYNAGWRVEKRDDVIGNSPNSDEGDYSFDRGDMVTSRVDLLTELDVSYKQRYGLRVSGAAWNDFAFNDDVRTNPALVDRGSYIGNRFSNRTKHFHKRSGEILDAYVFGNFDIGNTQLNLKAGRHTVLWGEAIALSTHAVSYAQTPTDAVKALVNPGADAKEVALPIGQISGSLQVTPEISLAAQYFYEWKPTRLPEGGTYLAATDFILQGPDRFSLAPGRFLTNQGIAKPKERGDFGVSARWSPQWLDGTLGVYYREFDEKGPAISLNVAGGTYRAVYPENAKLYGVSLSKKIGGMSVGAELLKREKTALVSSITNGAAEGARGDTIHALFNAQALVGPTSFWSFAAILAEVGYSRLDKVSSGQQFFTGQCSARPANDQSVNTGCLTKDAWQGFFLFSPQWVAVRPGWDLAARASLSIGLHGNSPVPGGGNYRAGSYSLGLTATYNQQHDFTIAYNDYLAVYDRNPATNAIRASNGSQLQDRGWVVFTYKANF